MLYKKWISLKRCLLNDVHIGQTNLFDKGASTKNFCPYSRIRHLGDGGQRG